MKKPTDKQGLDWLTSGPCLSLKMDEEKHGWYAMSKESVFNIFGYGLEWGSTPRDAIDAAMLSSVQKKEVQQHKAKTETKVH